MSADGTGALADYHDPSDTASGDGLHDNFAQRAVDYMLDALDGGTNRFPVDTLLKMAHVQAMLSVAWHVSRIATVLGADE